MNQSTSLVRCFIWTAFASMFVAVLLVFPPRTIFSATMNDVRQWKEERDVRSLINAISDEKQGIHKAAIEALGMIGDRRAIGPLINIVMNEDMTEFHKEAVRALKRLKDKLAMDVAVGMFIHNLESESWPVRKVAAEALGELQDARAVEPLSNALDDKKEEVCKAAIETLGILKDRRAVEPLTNIVKDKYKDELHKEVARALKRLQDKQALDIAFNTFLYNLQTGDRFACEEAVEALGELQDPRAIESLIKALGTKNK